MHSSVFDDGGGLVHLHKERRVAGEDVVRSAHSRKHAVHEADAALLSGHVTALYHNE